MGCPTCPKGKIKTSTKKTSVTPMPKKTQTYVAPKGSSIQTFYHNGKLYEIKR